MLSIAFDNHVDSRSSWSLEDLPQATLCMAGLSQFNLLTLPRNLLMFQLPLCPFQSLSVCLGDMLQYVCLRRHGLKMLILVLPQIALVLLVAVIRNVRSSSFACTLTPGGNVLPHRATFFPTANTPTPNNEHTNTHTQTLLWSYSEMQTNQLVVRWTDSRTEGGKFEASRLDPEACCTYTNVCDNANEN